MYFALRILLFAMAVVFALQGNAQSTFTINGRLKIEGADLSGARVVVYKNGEKERVITSGLGKFTMNLDLNANYILSFEKDGFVSKKLSFNTNVPAHGTMYTYAPFDYAVSLFKQYDDLNMVVFNQPVGIIRYEPAMGDFDYDTDYTRSIQSQLQEAAAAVERRQKEEAKKAEEMAKQKVAEEKALAKAKAEAEKQAAAQAKAEAAEKARAEAEARAKAEAERRAQEEAKKKAEADRIAQAEAARKEKAEADRIAQAEAARKEKEEADRIAQAEAARKEQEKPPPIPIKEPEPQPVTEKPAPPPAPKPARTAPPRAVRSTPHEVPADATASVENRRYIEPIVKQESSPVRAAHPIVGQEEPEIAIEEEIFSHRHEELIVEPNKVMTIVQLTKGEVMDEYRKVTHKWGGTFYFKNGAACTQTIYEKEAMGPDRVRTSPRGKLD